MQIMELGSKKKPGHLDNAAICTQPFGSHILFMSHWVPLLANKKREQNTL